MNALSLQQLSANKIYHSIKDSEISVEQWYGKKECKIRFIIPKQILTNLNINCIKELKLQIVKNSKPFSSGCKLCPHILNHKELNF
nr:MAG: hypothetical protein DiTV3a_F2ORF1 [Diabrotica toursvirus 3a]